MEIDDLIALIKLNLGISDGNHDLQIRDVCTMVCDYCNISTIPEVMESFIRKKIKDIIDYEQLLSDGGMGMSNVSSISQGDMSISYRDDEDVKRTSIYGLSSNDKSYLKRHRRLRRYGKSISRIQ